MEIGKQILHIYDSILQKILKIAFESVIMKLKKDPRVFSFLQSNNWVVL